MTASVDLDGLPSKAKRVEKENRAFFKAIKKNRINKLDDAIHALHKEVFEEIDCLECANCCKSLGPRITDRDIEQIAQSLRIKPSEVIATYLRIDEDNDYVFKTMPCPFLGSDNYCAIYKDRPKACREYPHTDRKKIFQIHSLTVKNAETCPAVFEILERLKKEFER
ncbi:YkgJ family cysteine cluster protein [Odoribacter sp. OttesenSCG-928-J03]|nr:YkgJ family cysteine cluster protein [Odoribacter sp. OttesenSCG-928-J03]